MAKDDPEIPYVDYPSIHFPSDRLTISHLRGMRPDLFTSEGLPPPDFQLSNDYIEFAKQRLESAGIPIPPSKPHDEPDSLLLMLRALRGDNGSIADLRREHADRIDVYGGLDDPKLQINYRLTEALLDMLWAERILARMAYQEACGQPNDLPRGVFAGNYQSFVQRLIDSYTRFGLVNDEKDARKQINKFTDEARADAPRLSRGR